MKNLIILAKSIAHSKSVIEVLNGIARLPAGELNMTISADVPDGAYNPRLAAAGILHPCEAPEFKPLSTPGGITDNTIGIDLKMLRALALSMSVKDVRYQLKGVHINAVDRYFEATDGHRVARVPLPADCVVKESFIIPGDAVRAILRSKLTTLQYGAMHGVAKRDGSSLALWFKGVDGRYPDIASRWSTVIGGGKFGIDADAVKQMEVYRKAAKLKFMPVYFNKEAQVLKARKYTLDERTFEIIHQVPARVTCDAAFSAGYLTDVLAQGCDEFALVASGAWFGALLATNSRLGLETVVMPVSR